MKETRRYLTSVTLMFSYFKAMVFFTVRRMLLNCFMSAPPLFKWESPIKDGGDASLPYRWGPDIYLAYFKWNESLFTLLSFHKQSFFNSPSKVMTGPTSPAHKICWKFFMFSYSVQSFPYILFILDKVGVLYWLCMTVWKGNMQHHPQNNSLHLTKALKTWAQRH